ncbi:MAG TPA: hypothetical protein PKM73_08390 [Verrucomicrobiota bacterium]|nr:hypothetical protein [Verrucomicrobiota bacterium]HNU49566.1 hypothetical protein [Verrucomicrobiota bacterium]
MRPVVAIARLTLKAAFRFRLVPVLALLLIGGVLLLPAVIKDDGTARGLTQIVLTYTLGLITAVLGLTTLWLACGTLAGDIEDCQLQVVAVKPVARWQIWLGKWLGILILDALLLGLCAGTVFLQLQWRARHLSPAQQEVLRNEIFVARGSAREVIPDLDPVIDEILKKRREEPDFARLPRADARRMVADQVRAQYQVVLPGYTRIWRINLAEHAAALRDRPLYLRIKFFAVDRALTGTYEGLWEAGPPSASQRVGQVFSHAAETFHEFPLPPNLLDTEGVLTVEYTNQNPTALFFPIEDGFEVLYHQGSFATNYMRGVLVVFCWLALLAAVGLAAASFLSFPVAAFFALGLLILSFSTGTMKNIVEQGTIREVDHDTGMVAEPNWFDHTSVGAFRAALWTVNLVRDFSPIEALSTGRTVSWTTLARAFGQIVVLVGGLFAAFGVLVFTRRELATAQGKV